MGGAPEPNARASREHWPATVDLFADLDGEFEPDPPPVDPDIDPGKDMSGPDRATGYAGIDAAALFTGVVALGVYVRRHEGSREDRRARVTRALQSSSAHLMYAAMLAGGGLTSIPAGMPEVGFILFILAFIVAADRVSLSLWDRLEAYVVDATDGPDRDLSPHGVSKTTKIVVLVGTILGGLYLVFAVVVSVISAVAL